MEKVSPWYDPNQDDEALLNTREAAQILRVSASTLEGARSRGEGIPFVKLSSRCVRYRRGDVIAYRDSKLVNPVG
jgi:predicted DNA-binding transcriptional regulator AlpA